MAGIDKIYGSDKEYDIFYSWVKENNSQLVKFFYEREGYGNYDRPLTNFPEWADKWLLANCPLEFVLAAIREQYNIKVKGSKKPKYVNRGRRR